MRKELLSAISALALMTGAAFAQDTSSPSATSGDQSAPAMQNQQGSGTQAQGGGASGTGGTGGTDMQAQGGGTGATGESDADVTIIEPGEGEEAGTDTQAQGGDTGATGESDADVTIIEPGEGEEAGTDMQAQDGGTEATGESDADVTIIEPAEGEEAEAQGEAAETTVIEPEAEAGTTMAADRASAEQMMGMSVVGSDGEELGEISDVIVDPDTGEAQQVVIASGGFLGLGERTVAVDYQELQIEPGAENVQATNLTQQMVEEMPEFEYTDDMASLSRQGEGEAVVTEPAEVETAQ